LNKNKKLRKQNKKIYLEKVSIPYRAFAYSSRMLFFALKMLVILFLKKHGIWKEGIQLKS